MHVRQVLFVHYFTSGFSYTDFMYSKYIYIYIYIYIYVCVCVCVLHAVSHRTQHKLVVQGPLLLGWEILGS